MNREFLLNIAFLIVINLLIKPFYLFGIDRTVQNVVPEGAYGIYFALFNFTLILQIINDLGVQHFNNRNIAQHRQLLAKYFSNILILKGLLGMLYLALVLALALFSGYSADYFPLLLVLAFNQMLSSLIYFLRSNISGLGLYRVDSALSVLDRLVLIVLVGGMLLAPAWRRQLQIEWFALAQTAALATAALAAFAVVRRRAGALRFRWRPRFLGLILRQSYPYALVIFLMGLYTRIDGVMIERLLPGGALEADRYASAYRLLDAANTAGLLFAGLLFPMFARLLKAGEPVGPLIRLSLPMLWAGATALTAATVAFRTEIMAALYDNGDAYSGQILAWLMISLPALSGAYIYGALLGAGGALRAMNGVALAGVALNVSLNWLLIPNHGALGAAAATAGTQYLVFFAQVWVAWRRVPLAAAPGLALRLGLFALAAVLFSQTLCQYAPGGWAARYLTAIAGTLALALPFRLLDTAQFKTLLPGGK